MIMSPQDWKDIEQALAHPHRQAKLLADGHELTLAVERGKGLRYVVVIYIDGKIEWIKAVRSEADAIERKFWRARRTFLYSPKVRAHAEAQAKRRGTPADLRRLLERQAAAHFEMLDPTFASARAACAHLRRHCTTVERISGAEPPTPATQEHAQ
jgi:hypothetical protein